MILVDQESAWESDQRGKKGGIQVSKKETVEGSIDLILHKSSTTNGLTHLTFKGEAGTNLVGSLVQVLGIDGSTETKGDTWSKEDIVGKSSNSTVVDLGL
ncbi:hypothetical protein CIHG_04651 [Coccidioides immitis H538.4]|uniref:Uncharacterized protein n=1 Tax=Coccidioides immitis H538.4 TaxID=396776 RepID=A0A0J8RQY6_COCIT|nr:hypothetical protein CIHG_04651 [Coccidioides immitis H538.4]